MWRGKVGDNKIIFPPFVILIDCLQNFVQRKYLSLPGSKWKSFSSVKVMHFAFEVFFFFN
jgi:hypothetical protein